MLADLDLAEIAELVKLSIYFQRVISRAKMKRILLAIGVVATAFLIGCGGGGGGSTPSAPSNPGNPGPTATPGGGGGTPAPTPTPSQSQNPASTVVTIGSPGPIAKTQVNTLASGATQVLSTVGRISATQNGSPMSNGAAINATITSSDKSGTTCLVYVANGSSTGSSCTYPAVGSTPAPVTIAHVNDGIAVQYNDGPSAPGGTFSISGNVPGASQQPAAVAMNNPAPGVGHTASGNMLPWGGGIVYNGGNIYFTQDSTTSPIGIVTYANGAASAGVTNMTVTGTLTGAPAGGLIQGPDGRLWGTEQNNTNIFAIAAAGGAGVATEYAISCPSGTSGGSATPPNDNLLGPQTGIVTDGTSVYVLCANVAGGNAAASANNTVIQINPVTGSTSATCTGVGSFGPFSNGATYAGGVIFTEELIKGGAGAGNASSGNWLAIPLSNFPSSCTGNFSESGITGSGDGNIVMMGDGNLYSETDNQSRSTSLGGAVAANPTFGFGPGGGGLVQDTVLGSGTFFGTAAATDLIMHSKWSGGTAQNFTAALPLSIGSGAPSGGQCEVAFNAGGGFGLIQLPDGKLAWPAATDGNESGRNWICIANL